MKRGGEIPGMSHLFLFSSLQMQFNFGTTELVPPPIAFSVIHTRIVPETQICQMVGFAEEVSAQNIVMQVLEIVDKPVLSRQTCNAVQNSNIQGHVGDQHICVADTATGYCGVR